MNSLNVNLVIFLCLSSCVFGASVSANSEWTVWRDACGECTYARDPEISLSHSVNKGCCRMWVQKSGQCISMDTLFSENFDFPLINSITTVLMVRSDVMGCVRRMTVMSGLYDGSDDGEQRRITVAPPRGAPGHVWFTWAEDLGRPPYRSMFRSCRERVEVMLFLYSRHNEDEGCYLRLQFLLDDLSHLVLSHGVARYDDNTVVRKYDSVCISF